MLRKGQFFSVDLVIGGALFLFILLSVYTAYNGFSLHVRNQELNNDLFAIGYYVSSSLIETSGEPYDWETKNYDGGQGGEKVKEDIFSLGLSQNRDGWVLDQYKINKFVELNQSYNDVKDVLGVRGPGYELFVNVSSSGNQYVFGIAPKNAENIVNVDRFGLLNGAEAKINVKVWQHG